MRVCEVIEGKFDEIISEWATEARQLHASARALTPLALIDHMPELLADLIQWLRKGGAHREEAYDASAVKHALDRLRQHVDLREVVDEYRILRRIVQRHVLSTSSEDMSDLTRFNDAIDTAIAEAVYGYADRRDREARHESARLRVALAGSRLGTWEWRPLEERGTLDEAAAKLFGVPAGEVSWERVSAVVDPEDRDRFHLAMRPESLAYRDDFELEYRVLAGGTERWVRLTGNVVDRDEAKRPVRVVGTVLDINVLKRAELRELMARRELEAFSRIGTALAEKKSFDEFLGDLLDLFMQSSPDVDTATILLCERSHCREGPLRVRASIGLEDETRRGYTIPIGKGFAGRIAASRQPLFLHDAARSDLVISEWVRRRGIRAFYGVPLLANGELVGVAHIGSRAVTDFSEDVLRLFGAMADRAAAAIAQAALRNELAQQNAKLEAVMAALPDVLFVADHDHEVQLNPAAGTVLGLASRPGERPTVEELAEKIDARNPDTGERIPPSKLPLVRALAGETSVEQMTGRHPTTGEPRHARVAAAPVRTNGEIVGAVAVWTDITDVVELARQRDTFMHAIVHDLRNPLNSIVTTAQGVSMKLAQQGADAWAIDRLGRIAKSALRLDRLLRDLLDVALARSGHIEIKPRPVRIADVLEQEATIWSATSPGHPLHVHACDAEVLADQERVVQVLDNLLGNAIKYSPEGGEIDLACSRRDGEAMITVRDRGVGITLEEQQRIFTPYTRAERTAWAAGHGLGLYICSEIVRRHGGRIGVHSEPGKGSEFWFTLPIASPSAGACGRGDVR